MYIAGRVCMVVFVDFKEIFWKKISKEEKKQKEGGKDSYV